MKFSLSLLLGLLLIASSSSANPVAVRNCPTAELEKTAEPPCCGLFPSDSEEDGDPLEAFNRVIFDINLGLDYILIEPIAWAYKEVVPEVARIRIGYILRNLNEPIVLANNLLQGELEDGRDTMWRFIFNSTLGVAGIFDVSTDLGIPYKKQDLGLTFASWGVESGPYLILPVLGPSTVRDAWGRLGDFVFDPVNWFTLGMQSSTKTCAQILDAKTDSIEIADDIKKNAIDHYASIRTWWRERRNALMIRIEDRQAVDTPRPDEEDDSEPTPQDEAD